MNNFRSAPLAVVPLLLLLTAACAQQGGDVDAGASGSDASYPADAVVFRMEYVGGYVPPAVTATGLPAVSVYGDGRVITQGATTLVYPGPALPSLQLGRIGPDELTSLITQARAAGVGSDVDLGKPPVADAASTRFTVFGETGSETFEVYALAESAGVQEGLTAEQRAARDALRTFAESLTSESGPLGAAAGTDVQQYVPTAVAAVAELWVARDQAGAGDQPDEQPEVAWPGPALPGDEIGKGLGLSCVAASGDAADKLLAVAARASSATPWTSGGQRWRITLRPLLPDETDCADLAADR